VAVNVIAVELVLLVVRLALVGREVDRHVDRLVLAEILPGEFVDVFAVDNWPEELFEQFVFPVGGRS